MSKYLLLRDNKQSGPHSFEEMLELGFRKYDLVWVDGKSAAWRYPGEINEFAAYAPLVEEQPFDRFFKKAVSSEQGAVRMEHKIQKETLESFKGVKHEEIEKRREALTENKQKQDNLKYLPKEKTEQVSAQRVADTVERHKKVAITMPATRKTNNPAIIPELKKQETKPEPRYVPASISIAAPPPAIKQDHDTALVRHLTGISFKSFSGDYTQYLQYAGVAAALISLLVIGILIGMSIGSEPAPASQLSVQQPSRIAELKEKLAVTETAEPMAEDKVSGSREKTALDKKPVSTAAKKTPLLQEKSIVSPASYSTTTAPPPVVSNSKREAVKRDTAEQSNPPSTTLNIEKIAVSLNEYKVNMFGGIDGIEVTVMNGTGVPVEEVVVELRYILSNRNKKYLTERVTFRNLKSGETQTQPGPKSNRGIKLESFIVSAN